MVTPYFYENQITFETKYFESYRVACGNVEKIQR